MKSCGEPNNKHWLTDGETPKETPVGDSAARKARSKKAQKEKL